MIDFSSPGLLRGSHRQTLYGALVAPKPAFADVGYRRRRWETPDGDFVDVDFVNVYRDDSGPEVDARHQGAPWVHLYHGLEGSSSSPYARMLMYYVRERGWRGSVFHFRGCSGSPNRLPRAYHSGDSDEIDWSLRRVREMVNGRPLYAAGVSLGGNALAKWLGERGEEACRVVDAAAAVSAPLDLVRAGPAMSRGFTRLYAWLFLLSLKPATFHKLERFPELRGKIDAVKLSLASTLGEFDDVVTAPLHGFRNKWDYWRRASARRHLRGIRVPTLLINAKDDPFMPPRGIPTEHEVSKAVKLVNPDHGGHVGFVSGPYPWHIEWLPQRLLHFFEHRQ